MDTAKNKKVSVISCVTCLTGNEVLQYIDAETLNEIKSRDDDPVFAMMSIGYEGTSAGELYSDTGTGEKLARWFKQLWPLKAVKQLVSIMKSNDFTPIYTQHEPNQFYRKAVGHLVASVKKLIDGVSHAIGIAYITDADARERVISGEYDACSLEAELRFAPTTNPLKWMVDNVNKLTGIALCNHDKIKTGFANSNILAVVTAMQTEATIHNEEKGQQVENKTVTFRDVKEYIEENDIKPERLFSTETLTAVDAVKGAFETDQADVVKKKDEEIKKLSDELVPYKKSAQSQRVKDLISGSELLKDEYKETVEYLTSVLRVDLKGDDTDQATIDEAIKEQMASLKSAGMLSKGGKKKADGDKKKNTNEKGTEEKKGDEEEDKDVSEMTDDELADPEKNKLIP